MFNIYTSDYQSNKASAKFIQKDPLHQLSHHEQTTIFRLRTGHCGLKGHLKTIGIQPSALCDCGKDDQTPNHFLQSCPLYNRERQHIWPVSTTMDAKLWGSANDLHLTTHFATLTGFDATNRTEKQTKNSCFAPTFYTNDSMLVLAEISCQYLSIDYSSGYILNCSGLFCQ